MNLFAIRNKTTGNFVTAYGYGEDERGNLKPRVYKSLGTARSAFANMYWRMLRRKYRPEDFEIVELGAVEKQVHDSFNPVTMNTIAGMEH